MWVAFIRVPGLYAAAEGGDVALVQGGRVWDVARGVQGVRVGQQACAAQLARPDMRLVTYEPTRHDRLLLDFWEALAALAPFVEPTPTRSHEVFCAWPGRRPDQEIETFRSHYPDARIGLGANRLVARLACPPQPGIRAVEPGSERGALATAPVPLLWTLGPTLHRRLLDLGLHTAGDVADTPEPALISLLGADGYRARQTALGLDPTPVRALYPPRAIRLTRDWDPPLASDLPTALAELAGRAAKRLAPGEGACRLTVRVRTSDPSDPNGESRAERRWPSPQADLARLGRVAAALGARTDLVGAVAWAEVVLGDLAALPRMALDLWGAGARRPVVELPGVHRGFPIDRYEALARRFDPMLGGVPPCG